MKSFLDIPLWKIEAKSQDTGAKYVTLKLHGKEPVSGKGLYYFAQNKTLTLKDINDQGASIKGLAFQRVQVGDYLGPGNIPFYKARKVLALLIDRPEHKKDLPMGEVPLEKWGSHPADLLYKDITLKIIPTKHRAGEKRVFRLQFSKPLSITPGMEIAINERGSYRFLCLSPLPLLEDKVTPFLQTLSRHRGLNLFAIYGALAKTLGYVKISQGWEEEMPAYLTRIGPYLADTKRLEALKGKMLKYCRWLGGRSLEDLREFLEEDKSFITELVNLSVEKGELLRMDGGVMTAVEDIHGLLSPIAKQILERLEAAGDHGLHVMDFKSPIEKQEIEKILDSGLGCRISKEYIFSSSRIKRVIEDLKNRVGDQPVTLEGVRELTNWGRKKAFSFILYLFEKGIIDAEENGVFCE